MGHWLYRGGAFTILSNRMKAHVPLGRSSALAPAPSRVARRCLAIAGGLLFALLLLEAVLQVASYITWSRLTRVERPPGRVLLCIGDSLTYGLGAQPNEAYPPRLQHHLAQRGATWSVVNAGVPGQNSADVVSRLIDLLPKLRPEAVCLLVGWNDTWARPAFLDPAHVLQTGFPWRWRTARLLSLWCARDDTLADHQRLPFLGAWHLMDQNFYFAADGTARLGATPATWTVDGEVLRITPSGGQPFPLRWRQTEQGLEFAVFGWDRFQRARRGPFDQATEDQVIEDMLHRRELDLAVRAFAALSEQRRSLGLRAAICEQLFAAGRTSEAEALFEPLTAAWEQHRDATAGEAVARRLLQQGNHVAATDIARAVLQRGPEHVACWRVLVDSCPLPSRVALAAELAAASGAQSSPWRRAELDLEQAVAIAPVDPAAAIALLTQARELGIGPDESVAAMARAVAQGADRRQLLAAVDHTPMSAEARVTLTREVRRATVDNAEMLTVLQRHIELAIDTCQRQSARVVLLGYPFAMPQHEDLIRRIAGERGVPFVSTVGAFATQLAGIHRRELFSDEIHCSARGYELMAQILVERLGDTLR